MRSATRRTLRTLIVLLGLGTALHAGAANIECWKNKDGVRECGNSVPPEYSQQRVEILNDQGVVIDVRAPAKTKEELEQEKREAQAKAEAEKRAAEQARQDQILLNTFTSDKDILLARDQKLGAVESIIEITQSSIESLRRQLNQLTERAADLERSGKQATPELLDDMADLRRQIKDKEDYIQKERTEKEQLRAEYAAQLKRFRELKGSTQ